MPHSGYSVKIIKSRIIKNHKEQDTVRHLVIMTNYNAVLTC